MPSSRIRDGQQAKGLSLPWHRDMVWDVFSRESVRPGDLSEAKGGPDLASGYPEGQQADSHDDDAGWIASLWQPPREGEKQRPRGAGVSTFARQLMAIERSRMRPSRIKVPMSEKRRMGQRDG